MSDRDAEDFASSACRFPRPPLRRERLDATTLCELELVDLLTARPTPTDAEIVRRVHEARRLLREAAAATGPIGVSPRWSPRGEAESR